MLLPAMTPVQLRAATSNAKLLYVKAGPGSGKTFLATEAFGYLRYNRYARDPRGIVGLTFARSARRELETRVRMRWGSRTTAWPNSVCTLDELHRMLVRMLNRHGFIDWPGGTVPGRPEDSWHQHADSSKKPGKKPRCALTLDDDGTLTVQMTTSRSVAPAPAFVDTSRFWAALETGMCTHDDVRNVLRAALDDSLYPRFNDAIRDCLSGTIAHLVVDEAFDMNPMDLVVVERAIEAGVSVTIVGDPWQSLYEFRGASPKAVQQLIDRHDFETLEMPGTHRYETDEMQDLAQALFDERPFHVPAAGNGDSFDVALAHDWDTLWNSQQHILPAGKSSRIDSSTLAAGFVLLLNEITRQRFQIEASGVGEARRLLGIEEATDRLAIPLAVLSDPTTNVADVWGSLVALFVTSSSSSKPPGKIALRHMERLKHLVCSAKPPPSVSPCIRRKVWSGTKCCFSTTTWKQIRSTSTDSTLTPPAIATFTWPSPERGTWFGSCPCLSTGTARIGRQSNTFGRPPLGRCEAVGRRPRAPW